MADMKSNELEERTISRRKFLRGAGLVVGGAIGGGLVGGLIGNSLKPAETVTETKETEKVVEKIVETVSDYNQALQYFTKEQFELVEAAMERIFPADENGPGAKELGAAYYIDHQLAGAYGVNGKEYRSGPFFKGEPTQGSQTHLYRWQIYDIGIRGIEDWCKRKYNKRFVELAEAEQDEVLTALQNGEVDTLVGYDPAAFFNLLRTNTLEGVYSDPVYGGNRDMGGWKLKKYPGAQLSYAPYIDQETVPAIAPVSLKDHMQH
jgi:gluconate 2-dehydrogenase gamma chain